MLKRACILGVCLQVLATGALGQVVFVDGTTGAGKPPGPPDGLAWTTAWPTVQQGIDDAVMNNFTEVLVAHKNTYVPTTAVWFNPGFGPADPLGRDATILLAEGVNVRGAYLGYNAGNPGSIDPTIPDGVFNKTILSGTLATVSAYHVVVADFSTPFPRDTVLDGFKIKNGRADRPLPSIGDLRDSGAALILRGGAAVLVENVTFRKNIATQDGGAVWARATGNNGSFKCRFSRFRENIAARGGALFAVDNSVAIKLANVVFQDNGNVVQDAPSQWPPITLSGGAVFIDAEVSWTASNCLFYDNRAREGGAVYWDPDDGNAPFVLDQWWRHCTFSFNSVPSVPPNPGGLGAAIYIAPGSFPVDGSRTAHFDNCIIWGNGVASDLYLDANPTGSARGVLVSVNFTDLGTSAQSANVLMPPGGIVLDPFTAVSNFDPLYRNPAARNLRLKNLIGSVSPAIDVGSALLIGPDWLDIDNNPATTLLPLDLDLFARIMDAFLAPGSGPDLGAYEASSGIGGQ